MAQKIRITFVVNDFLVGGMQRQLVEQLRFYDMQKFDISLVTLFSFTGKPSLYDEIPAGVSVYRLSFRSIYDVRSWNELQKLLKSIKPNIVVSSLFFSNTVTRILQQSIGYVSIAREHNTYIDKPRLHQWFDRKLASRSYRIVAVSTRVAEFTAHQEHISPEKFIPIQNGIDIEKVTRDAATFPSKHELQQSMDIPPASLVLLNVARLVPQKNHTLLIEGFVLFHQTHPEALLLIAGDGSERAALEELAHVRGVAAHVRFLGHREDVGHLYHAADVFVSTSRIEGFSNAYLEALANGVPLIATNTAGTDEVLEDGVNGFFIREETPYAVAEALTTFAAADQTAYAAAARASAARFDIRQTVRAYESLFEKAVTK